MTTRTTGKSAYSIMVMLQLPKLATGVRFPLGALVPPRFQAGNRSSRRWCRPWHLGTS